MDSLALQLVTLSGLLLTVALLLTGIVAIDDAWGMILFSMIMISLQAASGGTLDASVVVICSIFLFEILGPLSAREALRRIPGAKFKSKSK